MTSRMIAPTIAVSHELMSKNSSSGSASNSTRARNPPRIAPTTPMIVVTIRPPGSSPGRIAFAIAPASSPRMMNAMIPISPPSIDVGAFPPARGGKLAPRAWAADWTLLDDPAVRDHDQRRRQHGEDEDAAGAEAEGHSDAAADNGTDDPEQDRHPDRHRIGPRDGEPAEPADDEPGDQNRNDLREPHAAGA